MILSSLLSNYIFYFRPLEQYGLEFLEEIRECVTEEERRSIILQTEITDLKDKMMRMQEAFLGALQSQ